MRKRGWHACQTELRRIPPKGRSSRFLNHFDVCPLGETYCPVCLTASPSISGFQGRSVCQHSFKRVRLVKLTSSLGCASGYIYCDGLCNFLLHISIWNSWNLGGGVTEVYLGKQSAFSLKASEWVYRVHQQCWSAEKRLLHQELNSRLRTRVKQGAPLHFDCANLYFNLPPTSLNYQKSWWSQALLHHLKLFWDTCARWFWWTERQAWILDHLHTTVNNTSCVKLWKLRVSQPWGGGVWGAVCASFLPFPAALPGAS